MNETIHEKVCSVRHWRHRIPLPDGTVTPGSQDTLSQLPTIGLPDDLTGKSILDIGCSDGFFSFECEKRGAARVLAVDNFSSVYVDTPSGFMVAREVLASKVEFLQADLFDLSVERVGSFDFVLFLGVLYHLRHPLLALDRLVGFCREQIVVETAVTPPPSPLKSQIARRLIGYEVPGCSMQFLESDEGDVFNHDPTSWWVPSCPCMESMLRSVGFCAVRTFSLRGSRGVFHGFSPRVGQDAERLVAVIGTETIAQAARLVTRREADLPSLLALLRGLSPKDFGAVRQCAYELRAKQWHQEDRWKNPPMGRQS